MVQPTIIRFVCLPGVNKFVKVICERNCSIAATSCIANLPVADFSLTIICCWSVACSLAELLWPWGSDSKLCERVKNEARLVWNYGNSVKVSIFTLWDKLTQFLCVSVTLWGAITALYVHNEDEYERRNNEFCLWWQYVFYLHLWKCESNPQFLLFVVLEVV